MNDLEYRLWQNRGWQRCETPDIIMMHVNDTFDIYIMGEHVSRLRAEEIMTALTDTVSQ